MDRKSEQAPSTKQDQAAPTRRDAVKMALVGIPMMGVMGATPSAGAQQDGAEMQKVTGIGGFFFRAEDPEKLGLWYRDTLGIDLAPQKSGGFPWQQEGGFTVFDPFTMDDTMIPEGKSWMINFRVADMDKMVAQLAAGGNPVSAIEEYPHGRFATVTDPEGNAIQLWELPSGAPVDPNRQC